MINSYISNRIKTTIMMSPILGILGCVSPEQEAVRTNLYAEAQRNFSSEDEKICIESFKKNMNDPSSLQIAGSAHFDKKSSDISSMFGSPKAVFVIPIRGKNAYGGLVLKELDCIYSIDLHRLSFVRSRQTNLY